MKTYLLTLLIALSPLLISGTGPESAYSFKLKTIDGKPLELSSYRGKKILIVNTASECGYTSQYAALQTLSERHKNQVVVIGFPCNDFGGQEPGTASEIQSFCSKTYQVSFPMAAKVSVKGSNADPFFQWLCNQKNPDFTGDIRWNFEKILLDENGKVIRRFRSGVKPLDPDLTGAL
ncbi:MAG: glutathione peroxidase [Sphingobacteriales bacterium]|jgi:glutathione peroxidase|nr:glutathione peroxidase [Sphingobacteriales bacterium]